MTTKITINPANHRIEVAIYGTASVTKEVLEPGSAPCEFWIYQGRSIAVTELAPKAATHAA
jgi:hypothetical protein